MKFIHFVIIFAVLRLSYAQISSKVEKDSLKAISLKEVIVIGNSKHSIDDRGKLLKNIDEHLFCSSKVNSVRRGAYAWEASLNSMSSERSVITIDGMHIFGACTDKMDPITSYVETNNLSEIQIFSGQEGNLSGSIAGSILLKRKRPTFSSNTKWESTLWSGYESNGNQKILTGQTNYKSKRLFGNISASFRSSQPYTSGNNKVIQYSQFEKFNFSSILGKKFNSSVFEGDIIYDKAYNVGYPALPMDVSLAEAVISSLSYSLTGEHTWFSLWKSKLYYNSVFHCMDDTARTETPVHMDMPGLSQTLGGFSFINGKTDMHLWEAQISTYINWASASMTMYPIHTDEKPMFMYTWPEVKTQLSSITFSDNIRINDKNVLTLKANIGVHNSSVLSEEGFNAQRIFFPDMSQTKTRILPSFYTQWKTFSQNATNTFGIGLGERSPSTSEAYGYYLFNSFDGYDYIGNPNLKNERSYDLQYTFNYKAERFQLQWSTRYFFIQNYIIGVTATENHPMSYQAEGVRIYKGLKYAQIFNTDVEFHYNINSKLQCNAQLKYAFSEDYAHNPLPLTSPLSYHCGFYYNSTQWKANLTAEGALSQQRFNKDFGESSVPAYTVFNASIGYQYSSNISLQIGVENILNRYYYTYSDWKNIPRKGRSLFINIQYNI